MAAKRRSKVFRATARVACALVLGHRWGCACARCATVDQVAAKVDELATATRPKLGPRAVQASEPLEASRSQRVEAWDEHGRPLVAVLESVPPRKR